MCWGGGGYVVCWGGGGGGGTSCVGGGGYVGGFPLTRERGVSRGLGVCGGRGVREGGTSWVVGGVRLGLWGVYVGGMGVHDGGTS